MSTPSPWVFTNAIRRARQPEPLPPLEYPEITPLPVEPQAQPEGYFPETTRALLHERVAQMLGPQEEPPPLTRGQKFLRGLRGALEGFALGGEAAGNPQATRVAANWRAARGQEASAAAAESASRQAELDRTLRVLQADLDARAKEAGFADAKQMYSVAGFPVPLSAKEAADLSRNVGRERLDAAYKGTRAGQFDRGLDMQGRRLDLEGMRFTRQQEMDKWRKEHEASVLAERRGYHANIEKNRENPLRLLTPTLARPLWEEASLLLGIPLRDHRGKPRRDITIGEARMLMNKVRELAAENYGLQVGGPGEDLTGEVGAAIDALDQPDEEPSISDPTG